MFKSRFFMLFLLIFIFHKQNVCAMVSGVVLQEKTKKEKKFFRGTFALIDKERKIEPMVVSDLEIEVICEDLDRNIYSFVKNNDLRLAYKIDTKEGAVGTEEIEQVKVEQKEEAIETEDSGLFMENFVQDPIAKIEQKEECVETDKNGFEDLSLESGGEKLGAVEIDIFDEVSQGSIEIKEDLLHEDLAKFFLSNGIGRNYDHSELLDFCKKVIEKRGFIKNTVKKMIKNKKTKGLLEDLSGNLQNGINDNVKSASEALINNLLEFLLTDNKEQKIAIESETKKTQVQTELVVETKKREEGERKKNICLTFLVPAIVAVTPLISTLLSSGAATLTKYGLDFLSSAANSTHV